MNSSIAEDTLNFYIDHLTSRVDRHSLEQKDAFDKLFAKLDAIEMRQDRDKEHLINNINANYQTLNEKVHALEIASLKGQHSLGLKIATITGNLGTIYAVIQLLARVLPG